MEQVPSQLHINTPTHSTSGPQGRDTLTVSPSLPTLVAGENHANRQDEREGPKSRLPQRLRVQRRLRPRQSPVVEIVGDTVSVKNAAATSPSGVIEAVYPLFVANWLDTLRRETDTELSPWLFHLPEVSNIPQAWRPPDCWSARKREYSSGVEEEPEHDLMLQVAGLVHGFVEPWEAALGEDLGQAPEPGRPPEPQFLPRPGNTLGERPRSPGRQGRRSRLLN